MVKKYTNDEIIKSTNTCLESMSKIGRLEGLKNRISFWTQQIFWVSKLKLFPFKCRKCKKIIIGCGSDSGKWFDFSSGDDFGSSGDIDCPYCYASQEISRSFANFLEWNCE